MFVIKTPGNNLNERKYVIDIIFNEFLGVEYTHETGCQDYEIILPNDNKLIIKDMDSGDQNKIAFNKVKDYLIAFEKIILTLNSTEEP